MQRVSSTPGTPLQSPYNDPIPPSTSPAKPKGNDGRGGPKTLWQALAFPLLILIMGLYPMYHYYGLNFFLAQDQKMLALTSSQWHDALIHKSFLFIGGHHRGGTTFLWELLKAHPDIGGFGGRTQTGSDFSEGSFLQDVLPKMGVGSELAGMGRGRMGRTNSNQVKRGGIPRGLGSYALADESYVHWTEQNRRNKLDEETRNRLLNQWAYHWSNNRERPFNVPYWIEKTPTNAVVSRYLQAIVDLDLNIEHEKRQSRAKFVFIKRHPIANALAHYAGFAATRELHIDHLIENWLAIMKYMSEDSKYLKYVKFISLEALVHDPVKEITEILQFLELKIPNKSYLETVRSMTHDDPNKKYQDRYCDNLQAQGFEASKEVYEEYVAKYEKQISKYGYSLVMWFRACFPEKEVQFKDIPIGSLESKELKEETEL